MPRHRRNICRRCRGECAFRLDADRCQFVAVDRDGFDGTDLDQIQNVPHVRLSSVLVRGRSHVADRHGRTDDQVRGLRRRQDHALHIFFCLRHLVLSVVADAAVRDVAVFQIEVSQLPHPQDPSCIAVIPQSFVDRHLSRRCDACGRAGEVVRPDACAGCQCTAAVQSAGERRMPCQRPLRSVRRDIPGVRIESRAFGRPEADEIERPVVPFLDPQRQRERPDGRVFACDVEAVFALEVCDVHGSIFHGHRIRPDVPCHRIFVRPVLDRCVGCRAQLRSALSCQIIQRRHRRVSGYCCIVASQRVRLAVPRLRRCLRESFKDLVFACLSCCRCARIEFPEHARGVRSVQDAFARRVKYSRIR